MYPSQILARSSRLEIADRFESYRPYTLRGIKMIEVNQGFLRRLLVRGKRFLRQLFHGSDFNARHLVECRLELISIVCEKRGCQFVALFRRSEIADLSILA